MWVPIGSYLHADDTAPRRDHTRHERRVRHLIWPLIAARLRAMMAACRQSFQRAWTSLGTGITGAEYQS
jgi:hypothetical protein